MNNPDNPLARLMAADQRVLLVGPPGCAKTARIRAAAAQCGRELVVMRASLSERVDFGGALVPDMKAGITKALPLELLANLRVTTVPTYLFLDDLGQAPIDVQAALMRLFDEGELSPSVLIGGATNRPGDVAGVTRLCEPLRSRFHLAFAIATSAEAEADRASGAVVLGTWAQEVAAWCDWALDQGAAAEIVAWHRSTTGRTLYSWKPHADPGVRMPDYRTWEAVIRLWNAGIQDLSTISAAIGKPIAAEFLSFARLADKLPTPDQVWMDPKGAPVPNDPSALYLVASMLAAAVTPEHATALVQYLARLPRVYGALLARDTFRKLGSKLSGNKEWVRWFTANQEIFAVGS
jgi:hypothetical protein